MLPIALDPEGPEAYSELLEKVRAAQGEPAPECIVHLWSLDLEGPPRGPELERDQRFSSGSVLELTRALLRQAGGTPPRLCLVTRGAVSVTGEERELGLSQAPLWGLHRVITLEAPELHCRAIDLGILPQMDPEQDASRILNELRKGLAEEGQVAYRGIPGQPEQKRQVARLAPFKPQLPAAQGSTTFRPDATYLITGGLGGLGLELARWLVQGNGVRSLALVGRKAASEDARKLTTGLEALGAQIRVFPADISNAKETQSLITEIGRQMPPLRGIFHAAGVLDDGILPEQSWERLVNVLAPKMKGAWNLHQATLESKLELFVLFSSTASLMGNAGQATYAAANAFMDSFAHYRRSQGLPALSINWGPWAEVGMAAALLREGRFSKTGLGSIALAEGLSTLKRLIDADARQVGVIPIDWGKYLETLPEQTGFAFFQHVGVGMGRKKARASARSGEKSEFLSTLEALPSSERTEQVTRLVTGLLTSTLGLDPKASIDRKQGLMSMGMDSLMAVEFRNRLKGKLGKGLGARLTSTLIFNHPTVDALVQYLVTDVLSLVEQKTAPAKVHRKSTSDDRIAIIGMSCRFPGGADDLKGYWKLLESGTDAITDIPPERWDMSRYYDPTPGLENKMYVKQAGFISDCDKFDAGFFEISPREAVVMDPQHRLLLEVAWEALEDAGETRETIFGSETGIFLGISYNDYLKLLQDLGYSFDKLAGLDNSHAAAPGRLSYFLGVQGPSMSVNTLCSSSLVAIHLASQSLREGGCGRAIVGGVNLNLIPDILFPCARWARSLMSPAARRLMPRQMATSEAKAAA